MVHHAIDVGVSVLFEGRECNAALQHTSTTQNHWKVYVASRATGRSDTADYLLTILGLLKQARRAGSARLQYFAYPSGIYIAKSRHTYGIYDGGVPKSQLETRND